MSLIAPVFPAIIVHRDGSLELLLSIDCWRDDVDQWYWGDQGDFLVDAKGIRFEQDGTWIDQRPIAIPEWRCSEALPFSVLAELAAASPDPRLVGSELAGLRTADSLVAYLHSRLTQ